jgi:redox-sensitive bicupin YhaK (pirin superfamily)
VLVASGRRPAPASLRQPAAELFLGRLPAGSTVSLPVAPYLHLFLLSGVASVRDETGRAERLAAEDALRLTGEQPAAVTVEQDAEVLVWAMASSVQ